MESEAGCELWLGDASGNDPTVRLQMRLCPEGDGLRGEVQWSSLRSGWSVRAVSGRREGDSVELRDDRIVEERPEPGWVFCTVDRWSLARRGDRMDGRYTSAACQDSASVRLTLMVEEGGPGTTPPATPPPSTPPATPPPTTPPATPLPTTPPGPPSTPADPSTSGCGCSTVPASGPPLLLGSVLLFAIGWWRRRAG
jgi:MYXO-CTERM domain-containing protein